MSLFFHTLKTGIVSVLFFYFFPSDAIIRISYCGFNLHFFEYKWDWASLHIFMGHLVSAYENNFFRFFLALGSYVYILESVYYGFAIPPHPPAKKKNLFGDFEWNCVKSEDQFWETWHNNG